MAAIVPYTDVERRLRQFDEMRAARLKFDYIWQDTSDYILPRRDFSITQQMGWLRPRRVTSNVAPNANDRMAALLLSFLIDETRPFLQPNVKRGLVSAGRQTGLDGDAMGYLGQLEWQAFDRMMMPKAGLTMRLHGALKEYCALGNMVFWVGRRRGFGPFYQTRPLQACWWQENVEGEIDTLYYLMRMPLWRVIQHWPNAAQIPGWEDKAEKRDDSTIVDVLHCVEPRPGGRVGAVKEAKPFASAFIVVDKKFLLEEEGYDTFPYAVGRYETVPGQVYALGVGTKALPDIKVLNNLIMALEDAVENKARPPLAAPQRLFGKALDRRGGALNYYNPAALGLQRASDAIVKLDLAGDPEVAIAHLQYLTNNIELAYFVDWMRLRDSGTMSATEINDRRDLRLRGLSSIVATCGGPFMGAIGDRTLEVMNAEGLTPPPPSSLGGVEVDWEYAGPLQIMQLQGHVQAALQVINARGLVAGQDPAAAEAVNLEECLRAIVEGLGQPTGFQNPRIQVQQARDQQAERMAQKHAAETAATGAQAARDVGQGVGSLASAAATVKEAQGAGAGAPGGAPGAAFAPVPAFSPISQAA